MFSKKTFSIDTKIGATRRLSDMVKRRTAHSISRIGNYVYCCGGMTSRQDLIKSCERYDIKGNFWYEDMPDLNDYKCSMTMLVIKNTWLYGFNGAISHRWIGPKT